MRVNGFGERYCHTAAEAREVVAYDLRGTAKSLSDYAHEAEMDDRDFCTELDERVFACERCGWWDDADAMNNEICSECSEGDCYD